MQFESIIGELLLRHNCVIIPSFGGFVAKQVSAQIDYAKGIMLPPKKSLLFNRQLINNDGLLISEYASQNQVDYSSAEAVVKDKVSQWNNALRNGERVAIDKVGFLFHDQEKNICFEQDRFFNLLLSSYGLGKVHFVGETEVAMVQSKAVEQPIKTSEVEHIAPVIELNAKAEELEEKQPIIVPIERAEAKRKSSVWKYVAAACFIPIAFYTIWIPMRTDVLESGMISFHDFNPFYKSVESTYKPIEQDLTTEKEEPVKSLDEQIEALANPGETYQYNFSDDIFITVRLDNEASTETETVEEVAVPNETPVIATVEKGAYDFIVGCFGDESNATGLVDKMKSEGFNAYIVDVKGGLHRVSAGNAANRDALATIMSAVQGAGYEGWILKK